MPQIAGLTKMMALVSSPLHFASQPFIPSSPLPGSLILLYPLSDSKIWRGMQRTYNSQKNFEKNKVEGITVPDILRNVTGENVDIHISGIE